MSKAIAVALLLFIAIDFYDNAAATAGAHRCKGGLGRPCWCKAHQGGKISCHFKDSERKNLMSCLCCKTNNGSKRNARSGTNIPKFRPSCGSWLPSFPISMS